MPCLPLLRRRHRLLPAAVAVLAWAAALRADAAAPELPLLSPILGDNMVLQRGKPNRFWGWTTPGQKVWVELAGRKESAIAGADGGWSVSLEVPPAGGPYTATIRGPREVVLHNLLVGDVWVCGGQSNMAVALRDTLHGPDEVRAARHPTLRLCTVSQQSTYEPAKTVKAEWKACSPESAAGFSAVAYFFARRLQSEVNVPIGLVEDCLGGSPAESWMSAPALAPFAEFGPQLAEIRRLAAKPGPQYGSFLMHWLEEHDAGAKEPTWAAPGLDDRGWTAVELPNEFSKLKETSAPGVWWFRRTVDIPPGQAGAPAKLYLGEIDKMDTAYVNGRWVGASSWVEHPRVYEIPAGTLRAGPNVIAVRVFKARPAGGFLSDAGALRIGLADGSSLPLAGAWKSAPGVAEQPAPPPPLDVENYPTMPSVLYNGMIAPVAPLAITGWIWYQGEANTAKPAQYRRLLPALIADWRGRFQQGDLPFYIVGLPAFTARRAQPGSDGWAELREAQAQTAASVPQAGLAVTIDTGEADNIHPREKQPVGERLALLALARHYHAAVADSGPVFESAERLPHALKLHFSHLGGGLAVHGDHLGEFAVAGGDRQWRWAQPRIEGNSIVVAAPDVPSPVAARYAWQANPLATLFNAAGLPAPPFRTDDWPLGSGN